MNNFFRGALMPFQALAVLARTPRLWSYVFIPLVVNVLVGALLYGGLLFAGLRWVDSVTADTGVGAALGAVLRVILIIGLLIGIGFVLVRFGVVLGSPWYAKLSERLELEQLGTAPPAEPLTFTGITRDLLRAVGFELKKLLLVILIGALLLLVNLLPVAGQIVGTVGSVALGALISCLDFYDGPLERRRLSFRAKLGFIRTHFGASAGFGLVCLALVSVPLLNLLVIPVCVAAGTLLFCSTARRA